MTYFHKINFNKVNAKSPESRGYTNLKMPFKLDRSKLDEMEMPPPQTCSRSVMLRLRLERERQFALEAKPKKRRQMNDRERFLRSHEWRELREQMFVLLGRTCLKCGSEEKIQADHIKPRSKYPEMELDIDNLQPLCWPCNKAKGTHDESDYR